MPWPWVWKRRALAAEAENKKHEYMNDLWPKLLKQRDELDRELAQANTELAQLRRQIQRMSER
jgi:hypothetical protein